MTTPTTIEKQKIEPLDLSDFIGFVPSQMDINSFEDVGRALERIQISEEEIRTFTTIGDLGAEETTMFVVFNGDNVDNFNATGKWASGMMENPLPPQIVSRAYEPDSPARNPNERLYNYHELRAKIGSYLHGIELALAPAKTTKSKKDLEVVIETTNKVIDSIRKELGI